MSESEVPLREQWWREWPLTLALVTLTLTLLGKGWIASALDQPVLLIALLAVICGVILAAAIAIVRHADVLAHRLGESAGTLLLTLAVSLVTGRSLTLGLDAASTVMLLLSLLTSLFTFSLPRTNVLLGCVHLLLFGAYLMLMFDR